jgi:molecular chaperone GrpE
MATKRRTQHDSERHPQGPQSHGADAADPQTPTTSEEPAGPEVEAGQSDADGAETDTSSASAAAADGRAEELVSQLEEANNRYLRLAADFDNFKKRARQEQLDTMRYAAATVAERLLPVLDDAGRALSHAPEGVEESWLKGVQLTFQQLEDALGSVGVERIQAVGSAFDPKLHEAIGSESTSDHPEDTVVVELRPGYKMHDRVLRPALVKVARRPI